MDRQEKAIMKAFADGLETVHHERERSDRDARLAALGRARELTGGENGRSPVSDHVVQQIIEEQCGQKIQRANVWNYIQRANVRRNSSEPVHETLNDIIKGNGHGGGKSSS